MKLTHRALFIALIIVAFAPGCGDEDKNPIVPQPPSRSSIEALLTDFFEVAYQSKDGAMYAEMLDSTFQFEFLPSDADWILPPGETSWGKTADLGSTNAMFGSANVGGIALNISIDTTVADTTCAGCQRVETTITLRVTTRPNDPDPLTLAVDSPQTFVVAKDPADSTQWVIVRQYDRPRPGGKIGAQFAIEYQAGRAATEATTWGSIKGLYQ